MSEAIHGVVWQEGMLMLPHHFQQQDRYHERLLHDRLAAIAPRHVGVLDLAFDEEALARGQLGLLRCVCILPGGTLLRVGDGEPPPPARPIEPHLPPIAGPLGVYVALPLLQKADGNISGVDAEGGADGSLGPQPGRARFSVERKTLGDLNTGANEQPLLLRRCLPAVLFDGEDASGFELLRIGELERTETGGARLRAAFVPPCHHLSASPLLRARLRRLLAILATRRQALVARHPVGAQGDEGAQRVRRLVEALGASAPWLSHALETGMPSTEALYLELARLAATVMGVVSDDDPADLPRYVETDLGRTFEGLFDRLERLVATEVVARAVVIALDQIQPGLHAGRLEEPHLSSGSLYVVVGGELPPSDLKEKVPRLLKVGSADDLSQMIRAAVPGLPLEIETRPPVSIPLRAGEVCLRIERRGPCWESVRRSRTIGIHQPLEPMRAQLTLFAVTT